MAEAPLQQGHLAASRSLCDEDPQLFFPVGSTGMAADQIQQAKAVCPVRSPCLTFALTSNQEFGVWGGRDEDERRHLRRQWRAGVANAEPA